MESRYHSVLELLQQAKDDITFLTLRNAELEEKLAMAAAWEPTNP